MPVHYWSFEGLSLSTAPLSWKAAWNSVLVIGSLPLVPPVLYLMWYLRVISYLSVESLYHALQEIIVQPSSIQTLLRRIFPSYWLRPVIDLRHLIPCLYKYSFNWYEDLQSFREELLVFHLGYHHVDIFSGHQKFLGFSWPICFELCFTKLLRPLVKRWDSMSHCCFVYLDDGFSGLPESVSAIAASWVQFFQGFWGEKKSTRSFG